MISEGPDGPVSKAVIGSMHTWGHCLVVTKCMKQPYRAWHGKTRNSYGVCQWGEICPRPAARRSPPCGIEEDSR
eukprot:3835988-Amphidinium_carterae.1